MGQIKKYSTLRSGSSKLVSNDRPRLQPPDSFVYFERNALEQTIVARFEEQVMKYPECIAIVEHGTTLSYREVNERANQIAMSIIKYDTQEEEPVALLLEHGTSVIVAILGTLRASRPYVSLDPSFPGARNDFILKHSGASMLLTNQRQLDSLDPLELGDVRIVNIDQLDRRDVPEDGYGLDLSVDAPACVVYTSGSTGEPKGVIRTHQNILQDVRQYTNCLFISAEDRMTLLYSCSVTGSLRDIFGGLLNGATVYPVNIREEGITNLGDFLFKEEITFYHSVPSVFRSFASRLRVRHGFPQLRLIRLAGERVLVSDVELYRHHFSDQCILYTGMGATETGHIRHLFINKETEFDGAIVPTGYGIEDKEVLILGEDGKRLTPGHVGEIAVKSRYLSPGYWRDPDTTRLMFVSNPGGSPERIFKTGDLGRISLGGCLEHFGRSDFQLKVRGYRVEAAEIEGTLLKYPGIREVAVINLDEGRGDTRLVAYYTVRSDTRSPFSIPALRKFLSEQLPHYMLPSAFEQLNELPLTPNGKVDRRALPRPSVVRPNLEIAMVKPETAIEKKLIEVWKELLGIDGIGVHDSFFELGGHSLLAIQFLSRLSEAFNVDIPLSTFFKSPTVAAISRFKEQQAPEESTVPHIERVSREKDLPLTFTQEGIWFLQRLEPRSRAYHVQATVKMTGTLDVDLLNRCLSEMVRLHEIYRTSFPEIHGRPQQIIHPPVPVKLPVLDLQHVPRIHHDDVIKQFINEQEPFKIEYLPLHRWTLVKLSMTEYVFIYLVHHLISDGWSASLFLRELLLLYRAFAAEKPSPLHEPSIQWADYAHWERLWLDGSAVKKQLEYWKGRLTGSPPLLRLPYDYSRPVVQTHEGNAIRTDLPTALCEKVRVFSSQRGFTTYMTMISAFFVLLHRYSGEEDICIGTPVVNRRTAQMQELIGMMINTVALRLDLSGNPNCETLLDRVRHVALGAYNHQSFPFGKVVEVLQPKRSLSYSPIYQVMFIFSDSPTPPLELPDLKLELTEVINNESAKLDLGVFVIPFAEKSIGEVKSNGNRGMSMLWEYNRTLFKERTVLGMWELYKLILAAIVETPEKKLNELPMMTESDQLKLLGWNDNTKDYAMNLGISELFEIQARRTPDNTALISGTQRMSYRELDLHASVIAQHLQRLGIRPNEVVGICVERSFEFISALLGVLKTGAAFLTIDAGIPKNRIHFMLKDAGISVLLVYSDWRHQLAESVLKLVHLDALKGAKTHAQALSFNSSPTNGKSLAYVIYTSGSTGKPKGVEGLHRGLVNRLSWMWDTYPFKESEICCQKTSLNFVDSVTEIFGPLLKGVPSVLIPDHVARDPVHLIEYLGLNNVTRITLVPSLLRAILDARTNLRDSLPDLKYCFSSGETLPIELVETFHKCMPGCALVNLYGSSEASGDSTYYDTHDKNLSGDVPIGRPIANTQIHILNRYLKPIPIGAHGEIYISGHGIARGYMNRPDLNSARFIDHETGDGYRVRLYKTGDRGCYLRDGNIKLLGRVDRQVKLRGFRIEIGEIEGALREHKAVDDSVVILREDRPEDPRLAAYFVAQTTIPSEADLRFHLRKILPNYMVPTTFTLLDKLPLLPNGKVNRNDLPVPHSRKNKILPKVRPRNRMEKMLTKIWNEVIGIEVVGIDDNFFELGGHSLLATQVLARIRDRLYVDLPVYCLFEYPTIAELAEVIENGYSNPASCP